MFGVEYKRNTAVPAEVEVDYRDTKSFSVDNIFPVQTIGNVLDIKLKQDLAAALSWVSLTPNIGSNTVQIAPDELPEGEYTLKL